MQICVWPVRAQFAVDFSVSTMKGEIGIQGDGFYFFFF